MIRVRVRFKGDNRNLQLYYVDPDTGREVSRSAKTKVVREAERAALTWEQELLDRCGPNNDGWQHFRERFNSEHLAALPRNTRKAYRTALNHFERLIKIRELSEVSASTISIFRSLLIKEKRPITTVGSYLQHMRAAFNWAERVGIVRKAPRVEIPKTGRRSLSRGRPLTTEEFELMRGACWDVCDTNPFQWQRFLELLWYSGLRLGEALQLSWDFGPIRLALDAKPYPVLVCQAEAQKSGEDSAVPIPPDFASWLEKTPVDHRTGLVAPLRRPNGNLYSLLKAGVKITAIGTVAGVLVNDKGKFASAHDLRRSFATRWAMKVRPIVLQKLMRHKSITTTLEYYVGLSSVDIGAELWQTVPARVPKQRRRKAAG